MTSKQQDLLTIAKKGANDSDLFLLNRIYSLESSFELFEKRISNLLEKLANVQNLIEVNPHSEAIKDEVKIERVASKLAVKMAQLEKGDKGEMGPPGKDGQDGNDGQDGKDGLNGQDGNDADENSMIDKLKLLIPSIDEIKNDLPALGEKIRDGLELLQGDARLNLSSIKGIEQIKEELEEKIRSSGRGRRIMSAPHNLVQIEDVSSQLDGSTKTFTMPNVRHVIQVSSSQFPFLLRPTIDYTVGRGSITLTDQVSAFSAGQSLIILYVK